MTDPRTVRQKILPGARKWMGPWEGLVFMRLRRKRKYFIFCLTSPPEMQISSHRTTTTFCPFRSSFATIDASLPSMWCRASTTTLFAQIPDPETIFSLCLCLSHKPKRCCLCSPLCLRVLSIKREAMRENRIFMTRVNVGWAFNLTNLKDWNSKPI